jgi:hypothetical protein
MRGDFIAAADETLPGRPLLNPIMRIGSVVRREPLGAIRRRAASELALLPKALRLPKADDEPAAYPVVYSESLQLSLRVHAPCL